jgi:hypothetical protein
VKWTAANTSLLVAMIGVASAPLAFMINSAYTEISSQPNLELIINQQATNNNYTLEVVNTGGGEATNLTLTVFPHTTIESIKNLFSTVDISLPDLPDVKNSTDTLLDMGETRDVDASIAKIEIKKLVEGGGSKAILGTILKNINGTYNPRDFQVYAVYDQGSILQRNLGLGEQFISDSSSILRFLRNLWILVIIYVVSIVLIIYFIKKRRRENFKQRIYDDIIENRQVLELLKDSSHDSITILESKDQIDLKSLKKKIDTISTAEFSLLWNEIKKRGNYSTRMFRISISLTKLYDAQERDRLTRFYDKLKEIAEDERKKTLKRSLSEYADIIRLVDRRSQEKKFQDVINNLETKPIKSPEDDVILSFIKMCNKSAEKETDKITKLGLMWPLEHVPGFTRQDDLKDFREMKDPNDFKVKVKSLIDSLKDIEDNLKKVLHLIEADSDEAIKIIDEEGMLKREERPDSSQS